jgi:hypothetical protein
MFDISTAELNGILADEAAQPGEIVPPPTVTPAASLTRNSTSSLMRVAAMRPSERPAAPSVPARAAAQAVGGMASSLGG